MTTSLRCRTLVVLAALAMAGSCSDPNDEAHRAETAEQLATPERLRVILDYSPTVSDVGALLYLVSHPSVELMAVTLAGTGESDCVSGTRLTRAILELSGRAEVPVGCGRDTPIVGRRDWPVEWRNEAQALADLATSSPDRPAADAVDAEELLATTLASSASPITVVAVGPLTNVGAVLGARPELVAHVERVVVMGGAVDVPGNVEAAPSAEWNLYIDPEAARLTLASGAPVLFIALDATKHVPWTEGLVARLGSLDTAAARFEHDMVSTRSLEGVYLWDELAAVATIEPSIVTTEQRRIVIDDAGATVLDDAGTVVQVAIGADSSAATTEFVRVLAGGVLPPIEPLDDAEAEYLDGLAAATGVFETEFGRLYEAPAPGAADADAASLLRIMLDSIASFGTALDDLEPPPTFAERHHALIDSLDTIVADRDRAYDLLADVHSGEPFERLSQVVESLDLEARFRQIEAQCAAMQQQSLLRGGPRVCGSLGQQ